jgi:serine/threonine protein kinase
LKPENILIDCDGYAKLTDFGLSKDNLIGDGLTKSFCGTTEYLAPEIVDKQGYGKGCDWWSFGCVMYEMLTGLPPFYAKKKSDVYENIKFKNPTFYKFHSLEAVDLISRLLKKDPKKRLGSKNGAEEIKSHPFFADIDWDKMYHKLIPAPYKPLLDSKTDTNHFDQEILNMPIESPP